MLPSLARAVALSLAAGLCAPAQAGPELDLVSRIIWQSDDHAFGGLSGLEVAPDGRSFTAISDTAVLYEGQLARDDAGTLIALGPVEATELMIEDGTRPDKKRFRDTEGLALDDGSSRIFASAESRSRLLIYGDPSTPPARMALPVLGVNAPSNTGFEALAIAPDGALVAIPEGSSTIRAAFDVFRSTESGGWQRIAALARSGGFRPVGADFGPDGHLYILSRTFNGFGFATRVQRMIFEQGQPTRLELLFSGKFRQFDNLEGLSVWQNDQGIVHLVAISDDNFSTLQRTEIVEFQLKE